MNENASTTNKEKSKLKNPMMMKHRTESRRRAALSAFDRKVLELFALCNVSSNASGRALQKISEIVVELYVIFLP